MSAAGNHFYGLLRFSKYSISFTERFWKICVEGWFMTSSASFLTIIDGCSAFSTYSIKNISRKTRRLLDCWIFWKFHSSNGTYFVSNSCVTRAIRGFSRTESILVEIQLKCILYLKIQFLQHFPQTVYESN